MPTDHHNGLGAAWERYRSNPIRHLGALAAYAEKHTMAALTAKGFSQLSMQFSAPLSLLSQRPMRLTDMAERLNMSKQLCLQSLRPLKAANYIEQQADPSDGRARQMALSPQGKKLIRQAARELSTINQGFAKHLGEKNLQAFTRLLAKLATELNIPALISPASVALQASTMLGIVNRHLHTQLTQKLADRGYGNMQLSYGQVLLYVDLGGTPMKDIAEKSGVSLQALSRTVGELENRGLISRRTDAEDRRSRLVFFTPTGLNMIQTSVSAMDELENEMQTLFGTAAFKRFCRYLEKLYNTTTPEQDILKPYTPERAAITLNTGKSDAATSGKGNSSPLDTNAPGQQEILAFLAQCLSGTPPADDTGQWVRKCLGDQKAQQLQRHLATLGEKRIS